MSRRCPTRARASRPTHGALPTRRRRRCRGPRATAPALRAVTVSAVAPSAEILARGPWHPRDIQTAWRRDPFEPGADASAEADRMLEALRRRDSPAHDGLAARMV